MCIDLKIGDRVDICDLEGDWFESNVVFKSDTHLICHFINYSQKWNSTLHYIQNKLQFAPVNTHSFKTSLKYILI